jgi:hypothetical protein
MGNNTFAFDQGREVSLRILRQNRDFDFRLPASTTDLVVSAAQLPLHTPNLFPALPVFEFHFSIKLLRNCIWLALKATSATDLRGIVTRQLATTTAHTSLPRPAL